MQNPPRPRVPVAPIALGVLTLIAWPDARAVVLPDMAARRLARGEIATLIVEYDANALERDEAVQRARRPAGVADSAALDELGRRLRELKAASDRRGPHPGRETLRDYSHLPMRLERVSTEAALAALAADPTVRAVHVDGVLQPVLSQSLPLVRQPAAASAGFGGAGATIAVLDTGVDLANPAFGGCTAAGVPASCRVAAVQTFAVAPTADTSHGTQVAATALGVAPQARVAALGVVSTTGASFSDVISAVNWAIANRAAYNIAAINMSLADTSHVTTSCTSAFTTPVASARNAGIGVVAAAGNTAYVNGSFVPGLAVPACSAGAISVGALYDASLGGLTWGTAPNTCIDVATQANAIACFSQSGPNLSMLAPGALITAGGITMGGTSQAAPHVAGALAVLRSAFATDTLSTNEARLLTGGAAIIDPRSGLAKPRLDLGGAARPANDDFASRIALANPSGSATGSTLLATAEPGEPVHVAGGGQSSWWRWTAPSAGQVTLRTAGSDFDTGLAVYTGGSLAALASVGTNDDEGALPTSGVRWQAIAGTSYAIAVDGKAGSAGRVALQWNLDTTAAANLAATIAVRGGATAAAGGTIDVVVGVRNAGPQPATALRASLALPNGTSLPTVPAGCTQQTSSAVCTLPELASGAAAAWTLPLTLNAPGPAITLTASVVSDTPDPTAADNGASQIVPIAAGGVAQADVPTLPPWAQWLLAGGVLPAALRARRSP